MDDTGDLCDRYDLAMLDLDGVVYVGGEAVPGAADHLRSARGRGLPTAFITNNASRTPETVAQHLRDLEVDADADDVVTSAQAAARVLLEECGEGAAVALLGGAGLEQALTAVGLRPVEVADDGAAAIVSGYGPDVLWSEVMQAAVRIRDGLWWVASNTDASIPTAYGVAPGHGVLVDTLRRFSEVEPVVAGKPAPPLLEETVRRMACEKPLMVGDRIDTDIEGAHNVDIDSLLVMTGVTGAAELVSAAPPTRPTYVGADLATLTETPGAAQETDDGWSLGGWLGTVEDGRIDVGGEGTTSDWWRVVAATGWAHLDATGDAADVTGLQTPTGR